MEKKEALQKSGVLSEGMLVTVDRMEGVAHLPKLVKRLV